ncbi:methylated-DNA--[protein]-cysteine S-methyltransferase [Paenibacillus sp. OAS669]|uniref:methylated-DNA--[protein]-cysteine S-methyltransferase n=1 Tax=Paenibacillus sp. OAS669 TaxID=2663821 RepID=UPI00178B6A1F|nr:methylated-DNA--[protein]-cysteine S-methyltransferase [Paenibacillus sp. OAS669]MBE1446827.1 methylated-DNA-[protein]-cysteine S-methyltransferase [Paenibacillus sp. OAS669]
MNSNENVLYWTLLAYGDWKIHIAATSKGLCFIGSQNQPFTEMEAWAKKRVPGAEWVRNDSGLELYREELILYLQGKLTQFSLPFDYDGTPFQLAVWDALLRIPYGHTLTYSDIADQIQKPAAVRAVGAAIGANPLLIAIPCHRVIGKNGALTGYRGGIAMKERLLQHERNGRSLESSLPDAHTMQQTL